MHYRATPARRAFLVANTVICCGVGLACLLPILHVLAISFSDKSAIIAGSISFWPVGFTLDNYHYVVKDAQFFHSTWISIERTLLALVVQMLLTFLAAYPMSLSRTRFGARQFYVWFFMITILFSGGMIPSYLVVARLGLLDTIWALVLPGAVPVFHVILLQNFIKALPEGLSESASLDGAGHFRILFQIVLPLCKPSIATLCLFVAVGNWNAWFDGMLYINDNLKFPLQTYLRTLIIEVDLSKNANVDDLAQRVAAVGADTAKIFLAMVPILLVYPFLQKHFVKGIVYGSVKE